MQHHAVVRRRRQGYLQSFLACFFYLHGSLLFKIGFLELRMTLPPFTPPSLTHRHGRKHLHHHSSTGHSGFSGPSGREALPVWLAWGVSLSSSGSKSTHTWPAANWILHAFAFLKIAFFSSSSLSRLMCTDWARFSFQCGNGTLWFLCLLLKESLTDSESGFFFLFVFLPFFNLFVHDDGYPFLFFADFFFKAGGWLFVSCFVFSIQLSTSFS